MTTETMSKSIEVQRGTTETGAPSPVDDRTYNLLQALVSKLEALDAYSKYARDDSSGIFSQLMAEDRKQADRLLDEVRRALGQTS
jgi:hypothetical protein